MLVLEADAAATGRVLGFTDHDRDLAFDGVTYEAAAGFTGSAMQVRARASRVDDLEVAGALQSDRLDARPSSRPGDYDDAAIEIWLVNWQDVVAARCCCARAISARSRTAARRFTAEMRGLAHVLNEPKGRLFQYGCDADARRCALRRRSRPLRPFAARAW